MSLGERLKKAREENNWSQKYVAEQIGISNTVLSNYERNYREPDTDTLARLVKLYDVDADYIIGAKDQQFIKEKQFDFTKAEQDLLVKLREYPDLFYELLSNPEKKINEILWLEQLKGFIKNYEE